MIIFLDFDGVLNNEPFLRFQKNHATEENKLFDPENMAALNKLCSSKLVKSVIISSSWRQSRSLDDLKQMLAIEGFEYGDLIQGITPSTGKRQSDIATWLDSHNESNSSYLVIDDDSSLTSSELKVFKTSSYAGLRESDVDQIIHERRKLVRVR